jgi:hypothetical protein
MTDFSNTITDENGNIWGYDKKSRRVYQLSVAMVSDITIIPQYVLLGLMNQLAESKGDN